MRRNKEKEKKMIINFKSSASERQTKNKRKRAKPKQGDERAPRIPSRVALAANEITTTASDTTRGSAKHGRDVHKS